jgi:hypothetical protein
MARPQARALGTLLVVASLAACSGASGPSPDVSPWPLDHQKIDALVADGIPKPLAIEMALTTVEAASTGPLEYTITEHLPSGNQAKIVIKLATPGATVPTGEVTGTVGANGAIALRFEQVVPTDGLPADVLEQLTADARHGPVAALTAAKAPDNVDIVVSAELKEIKDFAKGVLAEQIQKVVDAREITAGDLNAAITAVSDIGDAWGMATDYLHRLKRIRDLRACAEHPTSLVTIKAYADDAGLKQRLLDQADAAAGRLKLDTAAAFLGTIAKGSLALTGVPWLGFFLSPVTDLSVQNLAFVDEQLVHELEGAIGTCKPQPTGAPTAPTSCQAPPTLAPVVLPDATFEPPDLEISCDDSSHVVWRSTSRWRTPQTCYTPLTEIVETETIDLTMDYTFAGGTGRWTATVTHHVEDWLVPGVAGNVSLFTFDETGTAAGEAALLVGVAPTPEADDAVEPSPGAATILRVHAGGIDGDVVLVPTHRHGTVRNLKDCRGAVVNEQPYDTNDRSSVQIAVGTAVDLSPNLIVGSWWSPATAPRHEGGTAAAWYLHH